MAKGLSIRSVRNATYTTGRLLGDVSAVKRGDIFGRVVRRVVGNFTGEGLRIFN